VLTVADIMTTHVKAVRPAMTLRSVVEQLSANHISGVPVVSDDEVVGIISTTDILDFETAAQRVLAESGQPRDPLAEHTVSEVMTQSFISIGSTATVGQAADLMQTAGVHRLLVVDDGVLMGLVSTMDLAKAMAGKSY
jgi:CBS domain-containing protein